MDDPQINLIEKYQVAGIKKSLKEPINNLRHIYNKENDFIPNAESFICPLCSKNIIAKQGIILQQCLHTFCKNCLSVVIENNVKASVLCPFLEYNCEEELLDSEIKSLVSKDMYDWHLQKSLLEFNGELPIEINIKKMEADNYGGQDYFPNFEEFQCPLCSNKIGLQKGITLQQCLHNFCMNCLSTTIERTQTARVQCPFNKEYICPEYLLDSEVKSLVSREIYEIHIQRSIYQFSRDTGENLGLDETKFEMPADQVLKTEKNINDKWKCNICGEMNSDKKIVCGFCDKERPPVILQYDQLIKLEESDLNLIQNYNEFECPICLATFGKGEGVLLRECLHEFCKECLAGLINSSDVPNIGCPYTDGNYICELFLQVSFIDLCLYLIV